MEGRASIPHQYHNIKSKQNKIELIKFTESAPDLLYENMIWLQNGLYFSIVYILSPHMLFCDDDDDDEGPHTHHV